MDRSKQLSFHIFFQQRQESDIKEFTAEFEPTFEPEVEQFEPQVEQEFAPEIEHQQTPVESPLAESETIKDFEQEKEEPEERHAQDAIEKDLQLSIETGEDFDEMSTQLNPDAKEFIPISPTRSSGMMSPPLNPVLNSIALEDAVVSQSPRKGEYQPMEDVLIPSELDFDNEADARPHEVENNVESPEILNLKESMQQDDKLEQEYKDEAQVFLEEVKQQAGEEYQVLEKSFNEYSNGFQSIIDDPMNRSFYEGRDNGDILTAPTDLLNSVQPIPTFEDDQPEADHQTESEKPEADLAGSHEWGFTNNAPTAAATMEASDNFEAERFVEEIKSAHASDFDKYVDQGLSPTLPEFSQNTIQTVQETIIVENQSVQQLVQDSSYDTFITDTSLMGNIELPETSEIVQEIEIPADIPEVPEIQEPPPTPAVEVSEPKIEAEVAAVAAAAVLGAAAAVVSTKKSPAANKTDVKPKSPATAKTSTVAAKKVPSTTAPKPAPITKPSSAPIRKPAPATTAAAAKPAVSSAATSRPKPAAPIRKIATSTSAAPKTEAPKPAPISRTTTLAAKKPASSVSAAKWVF